MVATRPAWQSHVPAFKASRQAYRYGEIAASEYSDFECQQPQFRHNRVANSRDSQFVLQRRGNGVTARNFNWSMPARHCDQARHRRWRSCWRRAALLAIVTSSASWQWSVLHLQRELPARSSLPAHKLRPNRFLRVTCDSRTLADRASRPGPAKLTPNARQEERAIASIHGRFDQDVSGRCPIVVNGRHNDQPRVRGRCQLQTGMRIFPQKRMMVNWRSAWRVHGGSGEVLR